MATLYRVASTSFDKLERRGASTESFDQACKWMKAGSEVIRGVGWWIECSDDGGKTWHVSEERP